MTELVIHGHFYQPPRENPWTGIIEREPKVHPFHDWNERIHHECYRPNAFARIFDTYGAHRAGGEQLRAHQLQLRSDAALVDGELRPVAYQRIIEADRSSAVRDDGHGNAIAQAYNHAILPLCNARDRLTQVRWGLADFRRRFGRKAESMWLPETACNDDDARHAHRRRADVTHPLALPGRARARRIGSDEWTDVSDGSVDPGVAYRYFHRDGSGRSIAIFFYDGPIVALDRLRGGARLEPNFRARAWRAARGGPRPPDSRRHRRRELRPPLPPRRADARPRAHRRSAGPGAAPSRTTARSSQRTRRPWRPRSQPGPGGEGTSWSCSHGVGRWYRDCGCTRAPGGLDTRRGARRCGSALDVLRDEAPRRFEERRGELLADPWAARDGYIELMLDPHVRATNG